MFLGVDVNNRTRWKVVLRMTAEGFGISLHELGFFGSGEARLMPGAGDKIERISEVLMQYGQDMRVEGRTDNVPIHNAAFASNWDLSTARAMAVAMMLLDETGADPQKMSIAGYAQYHPATSDATPEGRKENGCKNAGDHLIPVFVKAHRRYCRGSSGYDEATVSRSIMAFASPSAMATRCHERA